MPRKTVEEINREWLIKMYAREARMIKTSPALRRQQALAQIQYLLGLTTRPTAVEDDALSTPAPEPAVEAMLKRNADKRRSNADQLPQSGS